MGEEIGVYFSLSFSLRRKLMFHKRLAFGHQFIEANQPGLQAGLALESLAGVQLSESARQKSTPAGQFYQLGQFREAILQSTSRSGLRSTEI